MYNIVIVFIVDSLVFALNCENGFEYVKILKQSQFNANQEKFKIISNNVVVYENPDLVDFQLRELETCIPSTSSNQFTLELSDSYISSYMLSFSDNTSWTSGSWIEIQGKYGNIFFKSYLVDNTFEVYDLSLYYGIHENESVKYISGSVSGDWTAFSFNDSTWTEINLESPSITTTGTQYFRKPYTVIVGLAAYEVRLNYKYGIIVYSNGIEIFRDNMPDGSVTPTTPATGGYPNYAYRGVIRNGVELVDGNQVLAVELHDISMTEQAPINFNLWLAQYTSTFPKSNSHKCYSVPYTPEISVSSGNNSDNAIDYNKGSYWSISNFESEATISYQYSHIFINMNGVSIFPSVNPSKAPTAFTLKGFTDNSFKPVFAVDDLMYTSNVFQIETSPFALTNYKQIQLLIEAVPDETLWLYEMNPLVCSLILPIAITMNPPTSTAMVNIEFIDIQPTQKGFTNCIVTPSLPIGLSLDSETCRISGRSEQTLASTVFTITSIMSTNFTGTFVISIEDCQGGIIEFTRTYKSNAQREGFVIKDKNTNTVVFSEEVETTQISSNDVVRRLCLPSSEYTVVLSSTTDYWASNSFLYIDAISNTLTEHLLRTRFDNKIGLPTTVDFNINYAIPASSDWYYMASSVPSSWYNDATSGWTSYSMGNYPASSNRIQLYKHSFSISSLSNFKSLSLHIRYRYGCVIYINQHLVFQLGFTGDISTTSTTSHVYNTLLYRQVTLPMRMLINDQLTTILKQGSNTIAIGLLAQNDEQGISEFDCALRLITQSESNRIFDYSVAYDGISGNAANIFLDYYSNSVYLRTCTDSTIDISFENDRREAITSFSINTYYSNMNYLPGGVTLKAKNPEDSDYTLLGVFSGWKWWQHPQLKKMYLMNTKPYNTYRFENFNTGSTTDCYWKLNRITLYVDNTVVDTSSFSYESTNAYRGIELAEIYPSISTFLSFEVQPELPEGLSMDPYTGIVLGKPEEITTTTVFTVTALELSGVNKTTSFHLNITECYGGKSLITVNLRTDTAPTQISTFLYKGRGTSGEVMNHETSFPSNTMVYQDFCLPHAIYTFEAQDSNGNGWYFPAGYHMTIDRGTFPFFTTHVPSGEVPVSAPHTFSSYLPFQVDFDDWKVYKDNIDVPSEWNTNSFDDAAWTLCKANEIGTSEAITVYIRKTFDIPSLSDYHVLNVHMKYTGGVAAYFNGRLVARFNLDSEYTKDTEAPEAHPQNDYSIFHVILATSGATTSNNVLAFEIHRVKETSSALPIVFDATGIFGVEDCSPVLDSYLSITGTKPSTNNLEDAFDYNPSNFMNLPKTEGTKVEWIVENLEGSKFNNYGVVFGLNIPEIAWTLSGRFDESQDYSQLDKQTGKVIVDRQFTGLRVPVAYAGFKQYRWTMDIATTAVPRVSEFIFQYCKPASEGVCPGVGDYPSVSNGEISPASCPEMYEGYSYRICQDGVLSDIHTEHCLPKLPLNAAYPEQLYVFVQNTNVNTGVPTYTNIVDQFYLDEGIVLPAGLELDPITGNIHGKPTEIVDVVTYTVYCKNERGATFATVSISVRKGMCKAEGHFTATPVDETFIYECSKMGSYIGTQKRRCVLGEVDGEWEKPTGHCISTVIMIIVILVVIIIIVVIVFIIIRISRRKTPGNVKGKKSSSV